MLSELASFIKLSQLAKTLPCLREVLTPERISSFKKEALGLQLFYGTERVDNQILEALFSLAKEAKALDKMAAMQRGEVINRIEGFPSENRSVLHTSMRDVFSKRQTAPLAKHAADSALKEIEKLALFLRQIEGKYTDLVQIGIGGSDLGPRALVMALEAFHRPGHRVHFISNVDPDDAAQVLAQLPLKTTLFVVVSKSGTTLETLTNEELVRERLKKASLLPEQHFVAVTGEKSPMDNPSRYLACFYMWDFVGGRYSATSMVGAVALGFALGMEKLYEILRGAHEMDVHALEAKEEENLPLISALLGIWNHNFLHIPTVAILPYSQALLRFPAHLQQLDMESNGKSIDQKGRVVPFATGPVVWGEPGTNGQHSFYQLLHQGTDRLAALELIGCLHSQYGQDCVVEKTTSQQKLLSNLFAQSIAFAIGQKSENPNQNFSGNRPNRILLLDELTPYAMGSLLAFYEHKVALQGFIWGINSFDQEGVQLGKKLANQMLSLFIDPKKSFPLGEAFLQSCRFRSR